MGIACPLHYLEQTGATPTNQQESPVLITVIEQSAEDQAFEAIAAIFDQWNAARPDDIMDFDGWDAWRNQKTPEIEVFEMVLHDKLPRSVLIPLAQNL